MTNMSNTAVCQPQAGAACRLAYQCRYRIVKPVPYYECVVHLVKYSCFCHFKDTAMLIGLGMKVKLG